MSWKNLLDNAITIISIARQQSLFGAVERRDVSLTPRTPIPQTLFDKVPRENRQTFVRRSDDTRRDEKDKARAFFLILSPLGFPADHDERTLAELKIPRVSKHRPFREECSSVESCQRCERARPPKIYTIPRSSFSTTIVIYCCQRVITCRNISLSFTSISNIRI